MQTHNRTAENNAYPKTATTKKTLLPIPPHLSKEQMENSKKHQEACSTKGKSSSYSPMSYTQATNAMASILKIKKAFPALPNKKILEIYDAAFPKPDNKGYRIQHTMKGLSRKQAIVPTPDNIKDTIMGEANAHIFQINMLLKSIKSTTRAKFIRPCPGGISINTNSILNTSNLNIIERYLKSINGTGNDEVLALRLPQSKSYLKITGISYIQPNGNKLTNDNITTTMKQLELFEPVNLAAKPRVIKASPKSDMTIIWFDIWDSQNGSKAKLLINHSFNFGRYITTIRATNMNPPRLETTKGKPCPHSFKCINCKGENMADNNKCPFWKHRFNREWHSKKAQEARETRANSTCLAIGGTKI